LGISWSIAAGDRVECTFLIGWGASPEAAAQILAQAATRSATERQWAVHDAWEDLLGAATVQTPDPLFDALVNRWLLYQSVACRLWARAGLYQAGGAFGFRDQLQDTLALAWAAPAMLRGQILLCASRQFPDGDVQHWWHAPWGAGVRTHFSDDLLWLPYAVLRHLDTQTDQGLLDEPVPFLEPIEIAPGSEDAYGIPAVSAELASVYEHAARAIDRSLRVGSHGLPLMGTGDWNDGMNRVGHQGRGESVWLGWFLCTVVAGFAPVARSRGQADRADRWDAAAVGWKAALDGPAWDGQWYARAFFDDGQPLGSHANAEARIDLIAQAWAVLSEVAPPDRQRKAMEALDARLVDAEAGLVRLLDPPLDRASPSAGYIQAYPPGVRENGGQYSHAAVWALMAQARLAQTEPDGGPAAQRAWQYFQDLSPAHRSADPVLGPTYGLEPYVIAGDICSAPPYVGRGGWSWYTGAAAWLHRAAIESLFGLKWGPRELWFEPCLPPLWPQAELRLRRSGRTLHFLLIRSAPAAALQEAEPWLSGFPGTLLAPKSVLDWAAAPDGSRFVVPLRSPPGTPH
jgi:cyclic beta-1,2-glucan synthetase